MPPDEIASRKWKPFACPYCHVTFEKDWATARFRPYPTFASAYSLRAGDAVLRAFGGLLDQRVRGKGTVYRIGGEEFAILLPRFEREVAAAQAESLRKLIEAGRLADEALYRAKQGGRNHVALAEAIRRS